MPGGLRSDIWKTCSNDGHEVGGKLDEKPTTDRSKLIRETTSRR